MLGMKTSSVGSHVKAVQQTRTARPCVVVRSSSSNAASSSRRDMIIGEIILIDLEIELAPKCTGSSCADY